MAEKISVDVDKLLAERNKGNNGTRKLSLDDMRQMNAEDAYADLWRNKGKMTYEDVLKARELEDMRWERKQRLMQQTAPAIDVESIIEKATAPLKAQLEEMKRQQEKEEQKREQDKLQGRLDRLEELIKNGTTNKSDPIMEEIKSLKTQLADEKAKAEKAEHERFEKSIHDALDSIDDQIAGIQNKSTAPTKSDLERLEELVQLQGRYRKALGVPETNKEDEASTLDMLSTGVDVFNEKIPGVVKTIGTIRDAFKGGSDIPDDVPITEDLPTKVPSRTPENTNRSTVPDDIRKFLSEGKDTPAGFLDISGVIWQNQITGQPLTHADIESKAITDPESVRALMAEAYADHAKQIKAKNRTQASTEHNTSPEPQTPKTPDVTTESTAPTTSVDKPDALTVPEHEESPESPAGNEKTAYDEAMEYIRSGEEKTDNTGKTAWVGKHNETYEAGDHAMTTADLMDEAEADPEGFLQTVKEHLKALGE